jgi:hypothetical protein
MLARGLTPRDLRLTRGDAEEFVRRMLGSMHVERKARGEIVVRLGITGTGVAPNYRFDAPDGVPLVAYNGADHKPWPVAEHFQDPQNWSDAAWSYDELAAYRGELGARARTQR